MCFCVECHPCDYDPVARGSSLKQAGTARELLEGLKQGFCYLSYLLINPWAETELKLLWGFYWLLN